MTNQTTGARSPKNPILEEISAADVVPPAFESARTDEIEDALNIAGRLSNRMPINWAIPDENVTVTKHAFGDLKLAATGMLAVSELLMVLSSSNDLNIKPSIINGLAAAAVTLTGAIESGLDRATVRGGDHV